MKDKNIQYPYLIKPLTLEDGGGFVIEFPDLLGCTSDGETEAEAIANGKDAVREWIATCKKLGRKIPAPNQAFDYSGKVLLRLPKYLHKKLANRAEFEGVSLNSLAQTFIAEGIGKGNILEEKQIVPAIIEGASYTEQFIPNIQMNATNFVTFTAYGDTLKSNESYSKANAEFQLTKH